MNKEVVIIGGGIIGLCTAYYLQKEGHQVTVIDQSNFSNGASYINAGYITPSHFIPFAAPGMITKGLKWMFNDASPFYIKPRWDVSFFKWFLAFQKSATKTKVEKAIPVIKDINLYGKTLYEELLKSGDFSFHYESKGLLMLYATTKAGDEEWEIGKRGIQEGLTVSRLTLEQTRKLDDSISDACKGAIYYKEDAHMTPVNFMGELKKHLESQGVHIIPNETIVDIKLQNNRIEKIHSKTKSYTADEFVLATGSWSPLLAKKLNLSLLVQAGKGYSINLDRPTGIKMPAILSEAKVAVTPMLNSTRFAGTMELSGINNSIYPNRVHAIATAASKYYAKINIDTIEEQKASCGLRPCTPDGLPYIGKSKVCNNITLATGHAMMGWSLGPATGALVSQLISNNKTAISLDPFHPDRKF